MDKKRIVTVSVVDKDGNFLSNDVTQFPELIKRCAIAASTI